MHALHLKLLRELRRLWAQVASIALVMAAGVATLIIGIGTYQSLAQTRAEYYANHNFADIFVSLARAPRSLLNEIGAIDGVLAVDGRILRLAPADIEGLEEPASVLLISLPDGAQARPARRSFTRKWSRPVVTTARQLGAARGESHW